MDKELNVDWTQIPAGSCWQVSSSKVLCLLLKCELKKKKNVSSPWLTDFGLDDDINIGDIIEYK